MSDIIEMKPRERSEAAMAVPADAEPAKVLPFTGSTTCHVPPERVMDGAKEANLKEAFVIGVDQSGELYVAGSTSDPGLFLLFVERAKRIVISEV